MGYTLAQAKEVNGLITNQAFILQIDSLDEVCDVLLGGDGEKTYGDYVDDKKRQTFVSDGLIYFKPFRDCHGNNPEIIEFETLGQLYVKYGKRFIQQKDLKVVEVVEETEVETEVKTVKDDYIEFQEVVETDEVIEELIEVVGEVEEVL